MGKELCGEVLLKPKMPSDEELRAKFSEHRHHLIKRAKGTVRTPIGIVEGDDWYCFTCKCWLAIYGIKYDSVPSEKGAVWIDGAPPELKAQAEKLKPILNIQMADDELGRTIKKLRKRGVEDDTIRSAFEEIMGEG